MEQIKIRVTDKRIGHEKVIDFTLEGLLSAKGFIEQLPPYKDGEWEVLDNENHYESEESLTVRGKEYLNKTGEIPKENQEVHHLNKQHMEKKQLKDISTREVLEQQQKWWDNKDLPFTYEVLSEKYGSEKLVFTKMEKLVDEGYLEYGTSLRTAWLTDKAKDFLTLPS